MRGQVHWLEWQGDKTTNLYGKYSGNWRNNSGTQEVEGKWCKDLDWGRSDAWRQRKKLSNLTQWNGAFGSRRIEFMGNLTKSGPKGRERAEALIEGITCQSRQASKGSNRNYRWMKNMMMSEKKRGNDLHSKRNEQTWTVYAESRPRLWGRGSGFKVTGKGNTMLLRRKWKRGEKNGWRCPIKNRYC